MSSNTPNQPGDGFDRENAPSPDRNDPLASNPYSNQYQQGAAHDLDANAPTLKSNDLRRMNRRALFYLVAIVVLLLAIAFWLIKGPSSKAPAAKQAETITVPVAPIASPPLPTTRLVQAIPLNTAPTPPLPMVTQTVRPEPTKPQGPSLLERRLAENQGTPTSETPPAPTANPPRGPGDELGAMEDTKTSAQPLSNPDTIMVRGTFIRCVLQTRIISDFPGFTSCVVTEPVYSFTGKRLLLPKGSKVLGKYRSSPIIGNRLAVIWDRIITPTGIDVNMASPGVDDLGGSGNAGYLDSHWGSRIGAALLVSMLSDAFSYEAAEHGPKSTSISGSSGVAVETPFQSNTAQTLQNLSQQAVQKAANRPATVTINQGTIIDVYVAKDVDFSSVVSKF